MILLNPLGFGPWNVCGDENVEFYWKCRLEF